VLVKYIQSYNNFSFAITFQRMCHREEKVAESSLKKIPHQHCPVNGKDTVLNNNIWNWTFIYR